MSRQKVVVIGNGMVGQRFLETLVAQHPRAEITVFCEEPRPAYDRVQLTSYFSGKSAADLSVVPEGFFTKHGITLRLGDRALAVDREQRRLLSSRGDELPYDHLVLATGSYPFVPPIPGKRRPGCYVYRTLKDLDTIRAAAADAKVGTVIGGGLLGLEAAKALKDLGLATHVVWDPLESTCRHASLSIL